MSASPPEKHLRRLWRGAGMSVGAYRCQQHNHAPGPEQPAAHHVLNFAAGGLYLKHLEGRAWVVDRNCVMFTNAGEVFRTSHPAGCGDHGIWLSLSEGCHAELAPSIDPGLADRVDAPFRRPTRPMAPDIYLRSRVLATELLGGAALDPLERLRDPQQDLAELALSLDFSNHSHFSDRFRRSFGCTPTQARTDLTAPARRAA